MMNLLYVFNDLEDKEYITKQHKMINNVMDCKSSTLPWTRKQGEHITIGVVSGDFVEHPVSYFIGAFLERHSKKIKVICYSQTNSSLKPTLLDTDSYKTIRNIATQDCIRLIKEDKVDILVDLSGHTANNRMDIFAARAAPIQISYCGYPFTTGLRNMDYRITDNICDNPEISAKFYTEKLLFMKGCFLCYNQTPPDIKPKSTNNTRGLRIGCFNRLNKIGPDVIGLFNKILQQVQGSVLVFKTKALLNKTIQKEFLDKFPPGRIEIRECTVSHNQHLEEYNNVDVAIDTFPYSGTTTSCEALSMGVPVFSIQDTKWYYHPQNVTSSILYHSDLKGYICSSQDELLNKLKNVNMRNIMNTKYTVRQLFLKGLVCDKKKWVEDFEDILESTFKKTEF